MLNTQSNNQTPLIGGCEIIPMIFNPTEIIIEKKSVIKKKRTKKIKLPKIPEVETNKEPIKKIVKKIPKISEEPINNVANPIIEIANLPIKKPNKLRVLKANRKLAQTKINVEDWN
jgi:hypothetical protein